MLSKSTWISQYAELDLVEKVPEGTTESKFSKNDALISRMNKLVGF